MKVSTLTTPIQHNTRSTSWSSDKKKKRYQYWKGRSKIVSICRWHDFIYVVVFQSLSYAWFFPMLGLQHARLPCPLLSPRVCSNSCPLNQWCHPTISSSIAPFSSCPSSFLASGSFPVSQLFTSGGQRIGALASASLLPMNILGWFPLGLAGLVSLQSKGLSRVLSILWLSAFSMVQMSYPYMSTGKIIASTICTFVGKVMSLLFNTPSRLFIAFLPRRIIDPCLLLMSRTSIHSSSGTLSIRSSPLNLFLTPTV